MSALQREYLFIVNPVSGTGKQKGIDKLIERLGSRYQSKVHLEFTRYAGHASELAAMAIKNNLYAVAVVGGDGTVNETGKTLLHSEVALGIVPTGSGNGLARHFKIPLHPGKAVEHVFKGSVNIMDVGRMENHIFLSTAGFGFDAKVAHEFSKQTKRGFRSYIKTVRKELFRYQPFEFLLNDSLTDKAFMLSMANIPQFGNNFTVNPLASEKDGKLNCTLIKPFPRYKIPAMLNRFFNGKVHQSKYFQEWVSERFTLTLPHKHAHVDGEPVLLHNNSITCIIDASSLKIIY